MVCTNAELVRSLYVELRVYDLAGIFDRVSPEIRIQQDDMLPWGGEYRGYDGVRRFLERLVLKVDARVDVVDLVEAGDTVVAIGRLRGQVRATGATFDVHLVHVWTVMDGRLARLDAHLDVAAMLAALGGPKQRAGGTAPQSDCRSRAAERGITAHGRGHWRVKRAAALAATRSSGAAYLWANASIRSRLKSGSGCS
jgi:ketosteroid isomerase-like protein